MSLKGSVSPPRRETLASMAEEVFTEMRTKSADPFEDDMFIRRASSGRTAECIEGPGVASGRRLLRVRAWNVERRNA